MTMPTKNTSSSAALPDEGLRTDLVTGTVNNRDCIDTGLAAAFAQGNAWYCQLSAMRKIDVVRYAALHIANNSDLFEPAKGGAPQQCEQLALAIARSGIREAEAIFLEAACGPHNPAPDDELRNYFLRCQGADPSDGVTVGSLFNAARQHGADFGSWEKGPDAFNKEVLFVPGNEAECRKQLDRVVAADERTYTLGEPAGPLVILRVPDKDALPQNTSWDSDLPGTTLAMPADIMQRAERLPWLQRAGGKSENRVFRTGPPRAFVTDYLIQMRGQYGAPPLLGPVRVPRIDSNGVIHFHSGYDPQTKLFHDRSTIFRVPMTPSRDDARTAAQTLFTPFSQYQFEDPVAGHALLLSAIFTAIERPFLPVAPLYVVRSSMAGTGKGLIVRSLVRLAYDTLPVIATWGGSSEEFEKRLGALLLQAPGALSIDNANGMQIKGDLLESIITEGCADIRPLGRSETVRIRNRSLMTLTGNNPTITGDMARRTVSVDIQPRSADPERDRYTFRPDELVQRLRRDFLQAAFTAMRAFRLARMPRHPRLRGGSSSDRHFLHKIHSRGAVLGDVEAHGRRREPRCRFRIGQD